MAGDSEPWESAPEPGAPDAPSGARSVPDTESSDAAQSGSAGLEAVGKETAKVPQDTPTPVVPIFAPGMPEERRRRAVRSDAGELLAEQETNWDPGAATTLPPASAEAVAPEELPPDHIAVVRESDDDVTSWDAEPLPWAADGADEGEDDFDSWDDPSWDVPGAGGVTGPPDEPEPDEPPKPRTRLSGLSMKELLEAERPRRSGGPDLTPEQREEIARQRAEEARQERIALGLEKGDEDDGDEPAERRAADLLDRDDAQWAGPGDDTVGGVIE